MGKFIVAVLATLCVLGILVHFFGSASMGSTAVNVPGTEHTPGFGITWMLAVGVIGGLLIWRTVKGK